VLLSQGVHDALLHQHGGNMPKPCNHGHRTFRGAVTLARPFSRPVEHVEEGQSLSLRMGREQAMLWVASCLACAFLQGPNNDQEGDKVEQFPSQKRCHSAMCLTMDCVCYESSVQCIPVWAFAESCTEGGGIPCAAVAPLGSVHPARTPTHISLL
jgi:hypothetical protein